MGALRQSPSLILLAGLALFLCVPATAGSLELKSRRRDLSAALSKAPETLALLANLPNDAWAVAVDAGSTGSRINIFRFLKEGEGVLLDEFAFGSVEPGLSSYAGQPLEAAKSLVPLLDIAVARIPVAEQRQTPIMVGATAGLRLLPGEEADQILNATRKFLQDNYPFVVKTVNTLSGSEEGIYSWIMVNFLVGRLGKAPESTINTVDMGGSSMQETFAISPAAARREPNPSYVMPIAPLGAAYDIYTHSYLGYGQKAARAGMLSQPSVTAAGGASPCVPVGYAGTWKFNGKTFELKPLPQGASSNACFSVELNALNKNKPCGAPQRECTFDGAWAGKRASSEAMLLSSFWYSAVFAGLPKYANSTEADLTPRSYDNAAQLACSKPVAAYPTVLPKLAPSYYPFFCMDSTFAYAALTKGFGYAPDTPMKAVRAVENILDPTPSTELIEVSWALGAALAMLGPSNQAAQRYTIGQHATPQVA